MLMNMKNLVLRVKASVVRRIGRYLPGGDCICSACGQNVHFFLPFFIDSQTAPSVATILDVVGSNLHNYACPKCESNDRERHLILFCRRTMVEQFIPKSRILHFAPERRFSEYIASLTPASHVKADLYPSALDVKKVDMLSMEFPDHSFDLVIANHVLEHVVEDTKALSEIRRVLRPGGLAILQTPFSAMLSTTFEDSGIQSRSAREFVYGQDDHVRLFGADIFSRFSQAGFIARVTSHDSALAEFNADVYGVNRREPFFLFERT